MIVWTFIFKLLLRSQKYIRQIWFVFVGRLSAIATGKKIHFTKISIEKKCFRKCYSHKWNIYRPAMGCIILCYMCIVTVHISHIYSAYRMVLYPSAVHTFTVKITIYVRKVKRTRWMPSSMLGIRWMCVRYWEYGSDRDREIVYVPVALVDLHIRWD